MSRESTLSLIDAELDRLKKVRVLLAAAGRVDLKKIMTVQAKAKAPVKGAAKPKTIATPKRKRVLSPEARQRIADAQHKRWAAQKKNK
jgi:hypothetical protein